LRTSAFNIALSGEITIDVYINVAADVCIDVCSDVDIPTLFSYDTWVDLLAVFALAAVRNPVQTQVVIQIRPLEV
jgi:hypothetical protein